MYSSLLILTIAFACFFLYGSWKLKRDLHLFQLNSYRILRFYTWLKKHPDFIISLRENWLFLALILFLIKADLIALISWCVILGCLFFYRPKTKEKKQLVFTARASRLYAVSLLLFITLNLALLYLILKTGLPLITLFFILVLSQTLTSAWLSLAALLLQPLEKIINTYYLVQAKKLLKAHRRLKTIAITGSYGKTSTKFILNDLLSESLQTLTTPGSFNTPLGITKIIRSKLKATDQVFIAEMGAKQKGDIKELCKLVQPEIGIITAIGVQHLETFKSIENIVTTKFELVNNLPKKGLAVLNIDNKYIRAKLPHIKIPYKTYGIEAVAADYRATNLLLNRDGYSFKVIKKNSWETELKTSLLGRHNILNILAAVAVADHLNINPKIIARNVAALKPVKHRLELKKLANNLLVIDDAFNSNPEGSAEALKVLASINGQKRILVTPGMIELGEKEYELNFAFAKKAAQVCDYIILVGKKHSKPLQDGLKSANYSRDKIFIANDFYAAQNQLQTIVKEGDIVLYENDLTFDN